MFRKKEEYTFNEKKLRKQKKTVPPEEPIGMSHTGTADGWVEDEPAVSTADVEEVFGDAPRAIKVPFYKNRTTVGRLLIGAAVVVTLLVSPALNYLNQQETETVVVAAADIKKGAAIDESMIRETSVAAGSVLPIQRMSGAELTGKYAKSDIAMGEIISTPKLSNELPFSNAYLYTLPAGKKAMSVSVSKLSSTVSGKLEAGDIVSVYVAVASENKEIRELAQQPPELTYVEVLSCTNLDGIDITVTPEKSELENPLPATVTLAVDDLQAVILAGSEITGGVHLALVNRGDDTVVKLLEGQALYNAKALADRIEKASTISEEVVKFE